MRPGHRRKAPKSISVPDTPLTIMDLGASGDGITVCNGQKIFVAGTVPGDEIILSEITGTKGHLKNIMTPGPGRIIPPCPQAGKCGGCQLQYLDPQFLAQAKQKWVANALRQHGLGDVPVLPIRTVPAASRRRAEFVARRRGNKVDIGFHQSSSHDISPVTGCLVLAPPLMAALPGLTGLAENCLRDGEQADLHVTDTETGLDIVLTRKRPLDLADRETMVMLAQRHDWARISWRDDARHDVEPVAAFRAPVIAFGHDRVALPPASFLQAVDTAETWMAELVCAALADCRQVADLFCGMGSFALRLAAARIDRRVLAIDSNPSALAALSAHIRQHGQGRVQVGKMDLTRQMPAPDIMKSWDGVVFDPPRTGGALVASTLARSSVPIIVAVSCNPATCARDLAVLAGGGYHIDYVQPVDQFLWSSHVEMVAVLKKA